MDFAVPEVRSAKIKEGKNRNKYLNLARELKELWNMKVIVVLIVISAIGTIPKESLKGRDNMEICEQVENYQTTALVRFLRMLRRFQETWRK